MKGLYPISCPRRLEVPHDFYTGQYPVVDLQN